MRNKYILLVTFLLISTLALAQRNTRSPYSMFGIGDMESRNYGLHSGIAGTEIGTRTSNYLNTVNPAGISIDSLYFLFDIYTGAKISNFYSGKNDATVYSMNIKKIAIGVKAAPFWSTGLGIRPYSNTEYSIITKTPAEGGIVGEYNTVFEGDGGLAQLYWSNSFEVFKGFSLGVKASYVFGDVDKTETMNLQYQKINSHTRKLLLDFGLQYQKIINENTNYTIGAIYGHQNKFKYINSSFLSITNLEQKIAPTFEYSPQYFGIGFSLGQNKKHRSLFYAVDYTFYNWANIKSNIPGVYYNNSHKVSMGVKYIPNYRTARKYFEAVEYQLGAFYNHSHLTIGSNHMKEFGVTLGARLPIKGRTSIMFSADLGWRGGSDLIKEKYAMFTIGASLADIWFMKWMYD